MIVASQLAACVLSGFRREVEKNCAVLGHCAASSGNFLKISRDNLSVHISGQPIGPYLGTTYRSIPRDNLPVHISGQPIGPIFNGLVEDGTYRLSRNVGKRLPLLAAQ